MSRLPLGLALAPLAALVLGLLAQPAPVRADEPPAAEDFVEACSNGLVVPDPEDSPGLVQDCATLLSARAPLVGDATLDPPLNWGADKWLQEWQGVEVDSVLSRVVGLNLPDRGLGGTIPPELGSLSALRRLSLGRNSLEGEIPSELGALANLTNLGLYWNRLEGEIPPELGSLVALDQLWLRGNNLTGQIPPELGALTSLSLLILDRNQLEGPIPPELGSLASLISLDLNDNRLTGPIPPELGALANLERLHMNQNRLEGGIPPELGALVNLESLGLGWNMLAGEIPPELSALVALKFLGLNQNQLIGEIPPELGALTALEQLRLDENQLTGEIPTAVASLPVLSLLWLSDNRLSGRFPWQLGSSIQMYYLLLAGNDLVGCIPLHLKGLHTTDIAALALPRCRSSSPTVEVRISQSVSDPRTLHFEARLENGVWGALDSASIDATGLSSTGHHHFGDFTVVLPPGPSGVEVRLWQRVSDLQRLFVSARPVGGSWIPFGTRPLAMQVPGGPGDTAYGQFAVTLPVTDADPGR